MTPLTALSDLKEVSGVIPFALFMISKEHAE